MRSLIQKRAGLEHVFEGIVGQIKSLNLAVGQITSGSQEQSQGMSEVNLAVKQMDQVTESNAAGAMENAEAANELYEQVGTLQEVVGELQLVVFGEV